MGAGIYKSNFFIELGIPFYLSILLFESISLF